MRCFRLQDFPAKVDQTDIGAQIITAFVVLNYDIFTARAFDHLEVAPLSSIAKALT